MAKPHRPSTTAASVRCYDPRDLNYPVIKRLLDLSTNLGGTIEGDPEVTISGIAALAEASSGELAPLFHRRYLAELQQTRASAILTTPGLARHVKDRPLWVHPASRVAFANTLALFYPEKPTPVSMHESAVIAESAELDPTVTVGPLCVIEEDAVIGAGTVLRARCFVGARASIGRDCRIGPNAVVLESCTVGDRVRIGAGSIIGGDGFGFLPTGASVPLRVPQIGRVEIEDDVDIGALVAVDKATLGVTRIRRGAKIDNQVQVGHNVEIDEGAIIAAQSGLAGSVKIGAGALLGGQVGVADHLEVGAKARVAAKAGLVADVEPGAAVAGYPGIAHKSWLRIWGRLLRPLAPKGERKG